MGDMVPGAVFPFGAPLRKLTQQPPQPGARQKKVFVLGKYASAVHARIGKCPALAVASEPSIFWRGENAISYVPRVQEPVGPLIPSGLHHNGPSGAALDKHYLTPIRSDRVNRRPLTRDDVWLCDLVPHALLNDGQVLAIERHYEPLRLGYPDLELPRVTLPTVRDWDKYCNARRLEQIEFELLKSECDYVITLGEHALKSLLWRNDRRHFPHHKLSQHCATVATYGTWCDFDFRGKSMKALPLAHMRVTVLHKIEKWAAVHAKWASSNPSLPAH